METIVHRQDDRGLFQPLAALLWLKVKSLLQCYLQCRWFSSCTSIFLETCVRIGHQPVLSWFLLVLVALCWNFANPFGKWRYLNALISGPSIECTSCCFLCRGITSRSRNCLYKLGFPFGSAIICKPRTREVDCFLRLIVLLFPLICG